MTSNDKDLEELMQALSTATPAPDPATRRAHISMAEQTFADYHAARPGSRTKPGFLAGLLGRFNGIGGLTATTALVAGGFVLFTPAGQDLWQTGPLVGSTDTTEVGEASQQQISPTETPVATREQSTEDALDVLSAPGETARTAEVEALSPLASVESASEGDMSGAEGLEDAPAGASLGNLLEAPAEPSVEEEELTLFSFDLDMPGDLVLQDAPSSATTGTEIVGGIESGIETFANARPGDVIVTTDQPVSTFSIDVDTASYAIVRQSIMSGVLPPRDAVRVEEMINYFTYDYAAPARDSLRPFEPTITVMETPWNAGTQLVQIGLQGILPDVDARPPLNLVFLIDTSGSMDDPNKLPLLRRSFMLMLAELRPEDEVAIVTYAGSAGLALPATPASDRATIMAALNQLDASGSTNGVSGIEQAYDVAAAMSADGEVSRIILATDGDFNVGINDPAQLADYVADQRDTGVFLSVLGFGRGNLDDATMQALAQNGNGTAAYIDTLSEAQKVLVDQLTGALFAIAADVKVQVEWNPALIGEYRLIGYETRSLEREDFNNDRVDAGELGAGHSVTAIYEVTPVGSPALLNDPLRYGDQTVASAGAEMGFVRLRWKEPGADDSQLLEVPILASQTTEASIDAQFAAAIAGFGQMLRDDTYLQDWSWDEMIALARAAQGDDPFGYRREAIQLMQWAQSSAESGVSQD